MSTPLPPLVEPAAELTREEVARYSRHLIIPDLGLDGQKRLKNARVPVIGAGGISDGRGIAAAMMLGAAGVWIGSAFLASEEAHNRLRGFRRTFCPLLQLSPYLPRLSSSKSQKPAP